MRTTGYGLSALLVAAGAVLAWAVNVETQGVDLNQVGLILFFVGVATAVITLITEMTGRNQHIESSTTRIEDGKPAVREDKEVQVS